VQQLYKLRLRHTVVIAAKYCVNKQQLLQTSMPRNDTASGCKVMQTDVTHLPPHKMLPVLMYCMQWSDGCCPIMINIKSLGQGQMSHPNFKGRSAEMHTTMQARGVASQARDKQSATTMAAHRVCWMSCCAPATSLMFSRAERECRATDYEACQTLVGSGFAGTWVHFDCALQSQAQQQVSIGTANLSH
jgi:hypothetical protein